MLGEFGRSAERWRWVPSTAWLMLVLACVSGMAHPTDAAQRVPTSGSLELASRAFDDAQFRKDVVAIGKLLSRDLVYINGKGVVGSAAEFVEVFADPAVSFDPFVIRDRRVVWLSGEVATVTADGTISGTDGRKRFTDHFRFSDTFAWRQDRWQVVFVQVTRLGR